MDESAKVFYKVNEITVQMIEHKYSIKQLTSIDELRAVNNNHGKQCTAY